MTPPDQTTPRSTPRGWIRWLRSFGLATGLLLLVNVLAAQVEHAWARWVLLTVALWVVVGIRPLRTLLIRALVVTIALGTLAFAARNHGAIIDGRMPLKEGLAGMVGEVVRIGPARQLRIVLREREAAKRLVLDTPAVVPGSGHAFPGAHRVAGVARYGRYLRAVDHRNPEINRIASRLTHGCGTGDHLCESGRLVRFVTNEVEYRTDPRGGGDYVKPPLETFESRAGDCEDKTILLVSLLESVGIRTLMAFPSRHSFALVCFEQPLPELLAASAVPGARSGLEVPRYLGAPWDMFRLARRAVSAKRYLSGGRSC